MTGNLLNFGHLFTPEEDSLIIELKENGKGLTWAQISEHFTDRSKGTLQVRYCRQLSKAKGKRAKAKLFARDRSRNIAVAKPQIEKHNAKIIEAVSDSTSRRMTTRAAAVACADNQSEKTSAHAAGGQQESNAGPAPTDQATRATKAVAKRSQVGRKRVKLIQPTLPDGWRVIDPSDPLLTENEYIPNVFLDPPANRVVEYNSRSGSFRCRTRRPEDDNQQRVKVSQPGGGTDHEFDASDTITDEDSLNTAEELKRSHNHNKRSKRTRKEATGATKSGPVDGADVDYIGDSEAMTDDDVSENSGI